MRDDEDHMLENAQIFGSVHSTVQKIVGKSRTDPKRTKYYFRYIKKSEAFASDFLFAKSSIVFVFFGGTQATRANILVRYLTVYFRCDLMNIRFESALCPVFRVADVISGYSAFSAYRTYFAH